MPVSKGSFLLNADGRRRALADEEEVFIACVEDVLRSAPGLRYALLLDPQESRGTDPSTYAIFLVKTNPALDLALSIELREKGFIVNVNETSFRRTRGFATRFEWWVERRCRDLEAMVRGDLRLTEKKLMSLPVSSLLEAGRDGTWRRICSAENPMIAVASAFVPYGFLMGNTIRNEFRDWYAAAEPPAPAR